jgi:hypothetical protein
MHEVAEEILTDRTQILRQHRGNTSCVRPDLAVAIVELNFCRIISVARQHHEPRIAAVGVAKRFACFKFA